MRSDMSGAAVLVTGATSGIGRAAAARFAEAGAVVHAVGRREEKLRELCQEHPVQGHRVDVVDRQGVLELAAHIGAVDCIVHCAGGARGQDPVLQGSPQDWAWMWRTNVMGTLNVLQAFAPALPATGGGRIVVVTSVAAFERGDGSAGYSASKHAQSVLTTTMRNELLGTGTVVTEICPGIVETEFFAQRFPGDSARAAKMFAGLKALDAADVVEAILYAVQQPAHVNIDRIVLRPIDQAENGRFHRR